LGFGSDGNINKETVEKIGEALKQLPVLYSVELSFLKCLNVIDFGCLFDALKRNEKCGGRSLMPSKA